MATQVTLNSGSVDSAGSLALKTNGTTTAVTINSSQGVEFNAGTAALPSITTTGDTNTGIFFPAADTIAFSEGGAEAMRIDSSGNVGIGTASPAYPLTLGNNKRFGSLNTGGAGVNFAILDGSNNLTFGDDSVNTGSLTIQSRAETKFVLNAAERMRISSAGDVGIGTSTLTSGVRLISYNATNGGPATSGTTQASGAFRIQSGNNAACDFGVNGTTTWIQAADVTGLNTKYDIAINPTGGNLLVGTTNTSVTAGVGFKAIANDRFAIVSAGSTGGTTSLSLYSTGASAFRFFVQDSGNINATSTSITAISDISLKENIRDLETGLNEVMALKPRRFDWKAETHLEEKNIAGFIAQELIEVLPELVYDYQYNATEIKKSIKMGDILPTLVKAIQEQQALITALTARITALEAK